MNSGTVVDALGECPRHCAPSRMASPLGWTHPRTCIPHPLKTIFRARLRENPTGEAKASKMSRNQFVARSPIASRFYVFIPHRLRENALRVAHPPLKETSIIFSLICGNAFQELLAFFFSFEISNAAFEPSNDPASIMKGTQRKKEDFSMQRRFFLTATASLLMASGFLSSPISPRPA